MNIRVVAFNPAVGQLWETLASSVLAMTMRLHSWMLRACCDAVLHAVGLGVFFLRRKERSLCSSAAGTVVKKDEVLSISFQVSWLKLQLVSASP